MVENINGHLQCYHLLDEGFRRSNYRLSCHHGLNRQEECIVNNKDLTPLVFSN